MSSTDLQTKQKCKMQQNTGLEYCFRLDIGCILRLKVPWFILQLSFSNFIILSIEGCANSWCSFLAMSIFDLFVWFCGYKGDVACWYIIENIFVRGNWYSTMSWLVDNQLDLFSKCNCISFLRLGSCLLFSFHWQ